jgi:hypothetical protein
MGQSLNIYASRVAHIVGQPDNLSLKERVKDMIKSYFAKYIMQSIDRNGIQPYYKISLELELIPVEETKVVNELFDNQIYVDGVLVDNPRRYTYIDFKTKTKVPKPLNIKNDAPFIRVSIPNTNKIFRYSSSIAYRMSSTSSPTRHTLVYAYSNDNITLKRHLTSSNLKSTEIFTKVEIEGIWENPEEIIGYYMLDDNQDLDLPFPTEMLNFVIADLLKVEFGIVPKDIEIDKK